MKFGIILAMCGWTTLATASPTWPTPWRVFPWGNGTDQMGLVTNTAEQAPEGPVALTVSGDRIYIADDVNRRVVVLTDQGVVIRTVTTAKRIASLDAKNDGSLVLLSAGLDQWSTVGPDETIARFQPLNSAPMNADGWRAVAFDPTFGPVIVSSEGQASTLPLGATEVVKTAAPLGEGWHGVGRWLTPNTARIQVWPPHTAANSGQNGNAPTWDITVDSDSRLGMARPLRVDTQGRLYVWIELLSNHSPLEVTAEVRCYDSKSSEIGRFSWPINNFVAPAYRYVDIDAKGRLYTMAALPSGLTVWRLESNQWGNAP